MRRTFHCAPEMQAARDERVVGVTVMFVHFYPSGGYSEAPLEEAERVSIPAWHTFLQLRDQIVTQTKHLWEGALPDAPCCPQSLLLLPTHAMQVSLVRSFRSRARSRASTSLALASERRTWS